MKRTFPLLVMVLLLVSIMPLSMVSANGQSTTITTFSGGFATVDLTLNGGAIDNSTTIDIPRNVTFVTASFEVDVDGSDDSPGQVWLDMDEDGDFEWAFTGTGYGDIGNQGQFYNGDDWANIPTTGGTETVPGILIPPSSQIQSSTINGSFTPSVGGGLFAIGEYQDVAISDLDGDGNDEIAFLSTMNSTNSTTITIADFGASGISTSTPMSSCENASSLSAGDIDGDGATDLVAFSTFNSMACISFANGTSFDPVLNVSLSRVFIASDLCNIDGIWV